MSARKKASCAVLLGTFAALILDASPAFSQVSSKPIRVGVLATGFEPNYLAQDRGLVAGLRDHGYIEGKNLIIERRYAHLDPKRISVLAQELAGMKLDAIVTLCTGTTGAAKGATAELVQHDPIFGKLYEWELEVQRRRGKEFTRSKE